MRLYLPPTFYASQTSAVLASLSVRIPARPLEFNVSKIYFSLYYYICGCSYSDEATGRIRALRAPIEIKTSYDTKKEWHRSSQEPTFLAMLLAMANLIHHCRMWFILFPEGYRYKLYPRTDSTTQILYLTVKRLEVEYSVTEKQQQTTWKRNAR